MKKSTKLMQDHNDIPYLNLRLNQLETTVASLIGENAELKERIEKLEHEKMKSTQSPIPKKNEKEDVCVHNDYVSYMYNNVYPRIDPYNIGTDTALEYEKWESGMSKPVLNFYNNPIHTMSFVSDNGNVIRFKCNLCGKYFEIDRRLMTFSK